MIESTIELIHNAENKQINHMDDVNKEEKEIDGYVDLHKNDLPAQICKKHQNHPNENVVCSFVLRNLL